MDKPQQIIPSSPSHIVYMILGVDQDEEGLVEYEEQGGEWRWVDKGEM